MNRQRILIVDDSHAVRQSLRAYLTEALPCAHIREAQNGQHALDMVATERPDVILMDAAMPRVDGIAATRQVKAQWPEIWVVALVMDSRQRELALGAGADVSLFKGCSSEELLIAIRASAAETEAQARSQAEDGATE